ncbi:hypothetical protein H0H87_006247 [Tephrocybe sp. NHM501043]|nr:hypothetical protein H0H87_006247 [Tephrocybe sp. NHM501043]
MPSTGSSSSYPFGEVPTVPSNAPTNSTIGRASRRPPTEPVASTSGSSDYDPNQTEAERIALAEEKRRRNTAASARFRIKKKQRTTNLERTVSDLTGRAEDLEREASDLRRENGWLKEIVMLKGSRIAGANLAGHIMAESAQRAAEEQSQAGGSKNGSGNRDSLSSHDEDSSEEEAPVSKRKGKSRKK